MYMRYLPIYLYILYHDIGSCILCLELNLSLKLATEIIVLIVCIIVVCEYIQRTYIVYTGILQSAVYIILYDNINERKIRLFIIKALRQNGRGFYIYRSEFRTNTVNF